MQIIKIVCGIITAIVFVTSVTFLIFPNVRNSTFVIDIIINQMEMEYQVESYLTRIEFEKLLREGDEVLKEVKEVLKKYED